MNPKTAFTMVFLTASVLMTGCSSKESQERAILEALKYDRSLATQIGEHANLWEAFFGLSNERQADYVRNLKKVPLDGCPEDFKKNYQSHIVAWESRNRSSIESTWMDVLATARLHGVEWK